MFICKDPVYIKGDPVTDNRWFTIGMATDASDDIGNAHKFGQIEVAVSTDGSCSTGLYAYKNETNSTAVAEIKVGYNSSGNIVTKAPTPATTDNSTQIATTAFVKAQNYITASSDITGNAATATTATKLGASTVGGTSQAIYLNSGAPTAITNKTFANALINSLDTASADPVDADYYVSQYANGGTTTTTYHRRPVSKLYNYMKGKFDSVYSATGHTHSYLPLSGGTTTGTIKCVAKNLGSSYVNAAKDGGAIVSMTNTDSFGAWLTGYTKTYKVALATYPGSNEEVQLYSITKANVTAGTNTANKFLRWNASTGALTSDSFVGALTGNADTATKLGTANKGSATQPIYLNAGAPTACTYTLEKSVPSNAVFTDTNTKVNVTLGTTTKAYLLGTSTTPTSTATGVTAIADTGVYLDTTAGKLTATTFAGSLTGNVTGNCSGTAANVTGTVAIANGGTGATTRLNAAKALTNENVGSSPNYFITMTTSWGKFGYTSVADAKTALGLGSAAYTASTAYAAASHTHSYLPLSGGTLTGEVTLSKASGNTYYIASRSDTSNAIEFGVGSGGANRGIYDVGNNWMIYISSSGAVNTGITPWYLRELLPSTNKGFALGNASYLWKQLFASTTTISTSDERQKQQIEDIPDEVLDAWGEVNFKQFKFNDAVEEKGENARIHVGLIAQRIKEVFERHNLDPFKYGFFCYDEWDAQPAEYNDDGTISKPAREPGNAYAIRYEEAFAIEAAYQRRRLDRIEEAIKLLSK